MLALSLRGVESPELIDVCLGWPKRYWSHTQTHLSVVEDDGKDPLFEWPLVLVGLRSSDHEELASWKHACHVTPAVTSSADRG